MTKAVLKRIKEEAAKLRIRIVSQRHTQRYTGAEVNEAAKKFNHDAQLLPPNKTYPSTTTVTREVNHVEAMKKLYTSGGWPAVQIYISNNLPSSGGDGDQ